MGGRDKNYIDDMLWSGNIKKTKFGFLLPHPLCMLIAQILKHLQQEIKNFMIFVLKPIMYILNILVYM